jgi:hypothetical protein
VLHACHNNGALPFREQCYHLVGKVRNIFLRKLEGRRIRVFSPESFQVSENFGVEFSVKSEIAVGPNYLVKLGLRINFKIGDVYLIQNVNVGFVGTQCTPIGEMGRLDDVLG